MHNVDEYAFVKLHILCGDAANIVRQPVGQIALEDRFSQLIYTLAWS